MTTKLPQPNDMTPEQLAIALKNIGTIEKWIEAVKQHAYDVLDRGDKVPGYRLGYGVRRRIWKPDQQQSLLDMLAKLKINKDEIYTQPELLSPAKMEKVLKEHGHWPKKKRNEEKPASPLNPYIELSSGELKVLPITGREDDMDGKLSDAANEFG